MALGVVSERLTGRIGTHPLLRPRPGASAVAPGSLARTFVLAAGVTGVAEVAGHRIIAPVASHLPATPGGSPLLSAFNSAADLAVGAMAALVVLSAVAIAIHLRAARPMVSSFLALAAASTVAAMLTASGTVPMVNHVVVISAAAAVVIAARGAIRGWYLAGVVAVGVGLTAGQWPLLADSVGFLGSDVVVIARTGAELSLLAVPILFAVGIFHRRRRGAFSAAAVTALLAGLVIASRPDYAAIISLWAVGATLSLPPILYIAAAGCVGFLLWTWLGTASSRHLAAALVLLAVAGLQPAVVHHNLTALIALVVLALPMTSTPRELEA